MSLPGLRLATGGILFVFLLTHLSNHALALVSLEAAEAARQLFLAIWRNPLGTALFYGALAVHFGLALYSLFRRRRLKMPWGEAVLVVLGLWAPVLIASHLLGTRGAHELFGTDDTYGYVLLAIWAGDLTDGLRQVAATIIIWTHGCIGLYFWLRLKPWFFGALPWLYPVAALVPVLGLLGFVSGGRAIDAALADDPGIRLDIAIDTNAPDAAQAALLKSIEIGFVGGLAALLAAVLIARIVRTWLARRHGVVRITYPDGRRYEVPAGTSILETSLLNDVPHASVCGGRGRCSTCRVRINGDYQELPPPAEAEERVLRRVGAPPDVRLACQLRPAGDVSVTPLLPPNASPRDGYARSAALQGQEQEIAVLFADIRSFTELAEAKLPYDVVFVLNRYFHAMGQAIEDAGGRVDKFIGDGIMALFGVDASPETGSQQALDAARRMGENLEALNSALAEDLPSPLRIGIGIHTGPAIVGEMGYGQTSSVTAIGDTVNTASRLEGMTKEFGAQIVVSEAVLRHAGQDAPSWRHEDVSVRGRREPMSVYVGEAAKTLAETN